MNTDSKILLVDDEENLLTLLSLMLMEFGWSVATAARPEEALHMVQTERYHLAFIDNQLNSMNGIELIERIQEIDPDLPCVLMTGNLNVDMTVLALKKGVAGFLRKPFRVEELLVSIQQGNRTREFMRQQKEFLTEIELKKDRKPDDPRDE